MCFGLGWIEHILILAVVIGATVAILKLLVPYVLAQLGVAGDLIIRIINIAVWAVVLIALIYLAFGVIGCLWSLGWR